MLTRQHNITMGLTQPSKNGLKPVGISHHVVMVSVKTGMTNPRDGMDFEIANIPICSWPAEFRYCTELGLALSQMRVDSKPFLATVAGMEPAYWGCRGRNCSVGPKSAHMD